MRLTVIPEIHPAASDHTHCCNGGNAHMTLYLPRICCSACFIVDTRAKDDSPGHAIQTAACCSYVRGIPTSMISECAKHCTRQLQHGHMYVQRVGDNWDLDALGQVLLVGMALSTLSAAALFLFNDDRSLGVISEGLLSGQAAQQATAGGSWNSASHMRSRDLASGVSANRLHAGVPPSHAPGPADHSQSAPAAEEVAKQEMRRHKRWGLSVGWLPYLMCTSDCIAGLGSGISIKFMPLWLYEKVGLAPTAVNLVQTAVPFGVAAAALLSQRLSVSIGEAFIIPSPLINVLS